LTADDGYIVPNFLVILKKRSWIPWILCNNPLIIPDKFLIGNFGLVTVARCRTGARSARLGHPKTRGLIMPNKILYFRYKSVHRNDNSIFFATNNDFFFLRIMNNTNNSWQNATICNLFSSLNYALFVHVVNVQKLFYKIIFYSEIFNWICEHINF